MHTQFRENVGKPTLVCVPGLLGGQEDFRAILAGVEDQFQILFVDPNQGRREKGLNRLSLEETKAVSFHSSAPDIYQILQNRSVYEAYFVGVSLGGKIVLDFAIRYPEFFAGGVITDVAPCSFVESELYQFVDQIATHTDLNLSWTDLKAHFKHTIADRNLRSLIQSQIAYPNLKPPAIWKTGMKGLRSLLDANSINDQSEAFDGACEKLCHLNRKIKICRASHLSGITPAAETKIRERWPCLKLITVDDAAHFLHVSHPEVVRNALLELVDLSLNRSW